MKLLETATVSEYVARQVREQILSNEIKPGDPIRQEVIAEKYGVSIIPVREAFRQLEAEGIVELLPRRGVVAAKFTLRKALEWLNMRRLIEVDLIGRAIDQMTDEHIDEAEAILQRFDRALDQHRDMKQWGELNWEFHGALYQPANCPETMSILASLHKKCDRYLRLQLLNEDHIARAEKEHLELLEFCRARKKREAKALINLHIKGVADDLKEELQDDME